MRIIYLLLLRVRVTWLCDLHIHMYLVSILTIHYNTEVIAEYGICYI